MDSYRVYKEKDFSPETKAEIFKVMTDSFIRNPLIGDYLFKGNWDHVHGFIEITVEYYMRFGEVFVCKNNESGKIAAVGVFGTPGLATLSPATIIKSGQLFKLISLVSKVGFATLKKVLDYADVLEEGHMDKPHYYLYMLASVERGTGRLVLNEAIDEYTKEHIIFFESTVTKDDHAYYKSFGARPLGEIHIDGISNMFFVIDRASIRGSGEDRRGARSDGENSQAQDRRSARSEGEATQTSDRRGARSDDETAQVQDRRGGVADRRGSVADRRVNPTGTAADRKQPDSRPSR